MIFIFILFGSWRKKRNKFICLGVGGKWEENTEKYLLLEKKKNSLQYVFSISSHFWKENILVVEEKDFPSLYFFFCCLKNSQNKTYFNFPFLSILMLQDRAF